MTCIGGSHTIKEGNVLADRELELIICATSGPTRPLLRRWPIKVEKSLELLTANDVIILHLFDNIAYMARSEYVNGKFHVEGDLILTSKDWLYTCSTKTPFRCCAC